MHVRCQSGISGAYRAFDLHYRTESNRPPRSPDTRILLVVFISYRGCTESRVRGISGMREYYECQFSPEMNFLFISVCPRF